MRASRNRAWARRFSLGTLLVLLLASAAPLEASAEAPGDASVEALLESLRRRRDQAGVQPLDELVALGSEAAAVAMAEAYEHVGSETMRRAVIVRLGRFDALGSQGEAALERLRTVAVEAEPELSELALETLANCRNLGPSYLAMIVLSDAERDVRERAMEWHVASPSTWSSQWYREIVDARPQRPLAGGVRPLPRLRELAFLGLVDSLSKAEVVAATRDAQPEVRRVALGELHRRELPEAITTAERFFASQSATHAGRLRAAEILLEHRGASFARQIVSVGTERRTDWDLARPLADLLLEIESAEIERRLLALLERGLPTERRFALWASRSRFEQAFFQARLSLLEDSAEAVRREAVDVLAEIGDQRAVSALWEVAGRAPATNPDPTQTAMALEALARLGAKGPDWEALLVVAAEGEALESRNAALRLIGATGNPAGLSHLARGLAHAEWSTRLAALEGFEAARSTRSIGFLIDRMQVEEGRLLHEFGASLERLTGKPFGVRREVWRRWWETQGASFVLPTAVELRDKRRAERLSGQREITRSFFGARVLSERLAFVIDVSGSMIQPGPRVRGEDRGLPALEVAKRELLETLDGLSPKTRFNVIAFGDDVHPWKPRIQPWNEASRADAREYVDSLTYLGGTNLWAALSLALEDPEIDTLFVLSDGAPTVGELTSPLTIRDELQRWNRFRGVRIHTIAVGEAHELLRWLALDSGGDYVRTY